MMIIKISIFQSIQDLTIQSPDSVSVFLLRHNGGCNVRKLGWFPFGVCPDIPAFKVRVHTSEFKF